MFYRKKIFLRDALNSGNIAQAYSTRLITRKKAPTKGDQIIESPPVNTRSLSTSRAIKKPEDKRKVVPRQTRRRLGKNSQTAIATTVSIPANTIVGSAKGKNHHQPSVCHAINSR